MSIRDKKGVFCLLFELCKKTIFINSENFVELFGVFGHFLDIFGLVSLVTCAEVSMCAENSGNLMRQVQC